jgi:hypothetical protein
MELPRTRYAKSGDVSIAYQIVSDGPLDAALVAAAPDAEIADLVNGRALALLACEGIATAADVRGLCARTASYSDVCPSALPTHTDLARAALVGQRRRFSMRRSPHVHRDGELKPAQLQAV